MADAILSAERLRELLHYDPETGVFTWIASRGPVRAGRTAGAPHSCGYQQIRVDRRNYFAHRLAFLYQTGKWPEGEVDHINGSRDDNRFANLRCVSKSFNMHNVKAAKSTSGTGVLGVSQRASGGFQARIRANGKMVSLGVFETASAAHHAYMTAKTVLHDGAVTGMSKEYCSAEFARLIKRKDTAPTARSSTGLRGVSMVGSKFMARIGPRYLGLFEKAQDASDAYTKALAELRR